MSWISDNYGFQYDCEVTYQKVSISQLSSELSQVVVLGMVIAKQGIRRVSSKKMPGRERFVLNFTIRDSPNDTINAACWGEESAINIMSTSFAIGDIVKIKNPQITERHSESDDEKFKPAVKSQYQLNISPQYSEVTVCSSEEKRGYEKLLHCPMHHTSQLLNLIDIVYNSQNADGQSVSLLVAVREISNIQTVKTKDGREVKKLQLTVFDQSHPTFHILIWDEETANFIVKYCKKRNVILISDIKVNYNDYMKEIIATSNSTTVFTPDPDIPDARVLYQYAMKMDLPDDTEHFNNKYSDSSTIYTVEQIVRLMNTSEIMLNEIQGTLNVLISSFDVDSTNKVTSFRCSGCNMLLEKADSKCINGSCEIGSGMKNLPAEEMYDIPISISDNTGCIQRCLLGQVAQNFLGLSVTQSSTESYMGYGRYNLRISSCKKCDIC
ncbi:meiosis-specific with OB domain-containing protein [Trichonephila inaurata madagascariensis]|uniref:Meiosis-specific with OB domain-containing protein n=1 Tax=Trichonephila inaurata madagascariensis TaxID=2747483 RepID=A0A8X6Y6K1_9ARAC|nr:meiosis-specific with OB domain-containing protein [Trichonephila inaurata madagascariensis]